jgi:hypothetical protein
LKIALLILMAAEVASAQTTWKGLKFGMSEADVRATYTASFEKKPLDTGGFALIDRGQELAGSKATAQLDFDKNGKLEQIDLTMEAGSSLATVGFLTDKLVEKYGASVSQEGHCDLTADDLVAPSKMFTCTRLWKSDGQTITWYWAVKNKLISLCALVYRPLASDI